MLPSGVENEFTGAVPWTALKTRRKSFTGLAQARAANEVCRAADQIQVSVSRPEWQTSRAAAFFTRWSRFIAAVSQQTVTVVNAAVDHRPCCVEWQQFQGALHPPQLVEAAADHAADVWSQGTSRLNQS